MAAPLKLCVRCGLYKQPPEEIKAGPQAHVCRDCQRLNKNAYNRAYGARHHDRVIQWQREYRDRVRSDPERYTVYCEHARIYRRIYKERKGKPMRQTSVEEYHRRFGHTNGERVDAEPLKAIVATALTDMSQKELQHLTGVPVRRFYGLLVENQPTIALDTADRILTGLGVPLTLVYPPDESSA